LIVEAPERPTTSARLGEKTAAEIAQIYARSNLNNSEEILSEDDQDQDQVII
jgi:hypothetical protein